MLRQEMNAGYFNFIHRPGEKLGVLDNGSDFESCRTRTHCNATHAFVGPAVKWDEETNQYTLDDSGMEAALAAFRDRITGMRHALLGGGEHNNVYFPGFYHYRKNIPQALMQDMNGNYLELRDPDILDGKPIPMPAIDDPTLLSLYARQQARQAENVRGCHYVAGYVMGAEMLYPEFFSLGSGDYRPVFWRHFAAWCETQGETVPTKEETIEPGSAARGLWLRFREQAMADRAAYYYRAILDKDDTHLCFYPTHGSTMQGVSRARLGQQADSLVASCDGIEMGHILIDDDAERRNVIMIAQNAAFGAPVIVPRLGNKTADLGAAGGGRSFTPQTLRRLVYECAGLGVSVIYPIHWRSHLHDGEWLIKDTPAEEECRKVFDELTLAAPYTTGMGRLQPEIGVLAADDTWLAGWQPRWTALMQDAYAARAAMTLVTDALVDDALSDRMPLLISVDNASVGAKTLSRLTQYLDGGGKLLVWGAFAEGAEAALREAVVSHPNCRISAAPETAAKRVIREMFLTGIRLGTWGTRDICHAVDFAALCAEIEAFAPSAVLRPFIAEGDPGETNVYALTDRASMLAVCVNNGEREAVFTLAPDPRLLSGNLCARDAVTGEPVAMPLRLPGHGARMIFFGEAVGDDFEASICAAEDAFHAWDNARADVGPLRHNYSGMRSGYHREKRLALAKALLNSLTVTPEVSREADGALVIRARVLDAAGNTPENAKVTLRVTPGAYRWVHLRKDGDRYVCRMAKDALPVVYDPDEVRYAPATGVVRLVLQAEDGARLGGCVASATL